MLMKGARRGGSGTIFFMVELPCGYEDTTTRILSHEIKVAAMYGVRNPGHKVNPARPRSARTRPP
ncbi:hypothetical protein DMX05_20235, partial [Pseudomonas soli]